MRIMVDFKGGPLDGPALLEREIKAGDSITFLEMVIMTMGTTSGFQYNKGHHFTIPSPGWLTRTVVHRSRTEGKIQGFKYVIVEREEAPDELLLVAHFVPPAPETQT